jgi:hypothetical protein
MDALPAIPAPAVGETVSISMEPSRDGTISYRVTRSQKVKQTASANGGSYTQLVSTEVAIGDPSPPAATSPAVGTSYEVTLEKSADGTNNWKKVTITRQGVSQAFVSTYDSEKMSWVIGETLTEFHGVTSGQLPTPSGSCYRWENIRVNDDGTFTGGLREYDITGFQSFVMPGSVSYNVEEPVFYENYSKQRILYYTVECGSTYSGPNAWNNISGGTEKSKVMKFSAWDKEIFYYEKWVLTLVGPETLT